MHAVLISVLAIGIPVTQVSTTYAAVESRPLRWEGSIPPVARNPALWRELVDQMTQRGLYMGAMAASARMLTLFQDTDSKDVAYRTIVRLVDDGYPFNTRELFRTGDLQPSDDFDFVNSYNLYKYIINSEDKMQRWAEHYLKQVDPNEFPKYQFYLAIEKYVAGDYAGSEELLKGILKKDLGPASLPLVRKVARTLARSYFERKQYEQSYNIYEQFLLKLNPITPSDWLEASWSLFYLKRYDQALGMLLNLESKSAGTFVNLEKYTLRALAYQNLCAIGYADQLIRSFERDFGPVINALKRGESIARYPQLIRLDVPGNAEFRRLAMGVLLLKTEARSRDTLPGNVRALADHLYQSEVRVLAQQLQIYLDRGLEQAAIKLVMMGEHLRFIRFDVQREQYNPDLVFQTSPKENSTPVLREIDDQTFEIAWTQFGDFWRDERLNFKAPLTSRCSTSR